MNHIKFLEQNYVALAQDELDQYTEGLIGDITRQFIHEIQKDYQIRYHDAMQLSNSLLLKYLCEQVVETNIVPPTEKIVEYYDTQYTVPFNAKCIAMDSDGKIHWFDTDEIEPNHFEWVFRDGGNFGLLETKITDGWKGSLVRI